MSWESQEVLDPVYSFSYSHLVLYLITVGFSLMIYFVSPYVSVDASVCCLSFPLHYGDHSSTGELRVVRQCDTHISQQVPLISLKFNSHPVDRPLIEVNQ